MGIPVAGSNGFAIVSVGGYQGGRGNDLALSVYHAALQPWSKHCPSLSLLWKNGKNELLARLAPGIEWLLSLGVRFLRQLPGAAIQVMEKAVR